MNNTNELFAMCDPRLAYINRPLQFVEKPPTGILINKDTPNQESYFTVKTEPVITIEEIKND